MPGANGAGRGSRAAEGADRLGGRITGPGVRGTLFPFRYVLGRIVVVVFVLALCGVLGRVADAAFVAGGGWGDRRHFAGAGVVDLDPERLDHVVGALGAGHRRGVTLSGGLSVMRSGPFGAL